MNRRKTKIDLSAGTHLCFLTCAFVRDSTKASSQRCQLVTSTQTRRNPREHWQKVSHQTLGTHSQTQFWRTKGKFVSLCECRFKVSPSEPGLASRPFRQTDQIPGKRKQMRLQEKHQGSARKLQKQARGWFCILTRGLIERKKSSSFTQKLKNPS